MLARLSSNRNTIAWSDDTLDEHRAINTGLVVIEAVDRAEHVGVLHGAVRVQRDHLATRVTIGDGNYGFIADA
jgi:hypothetical protein